MIIFDWRAMVLWLVSSDAGKDDILRQFVDASDLAEQVTLMRSVSIASYVCFCCRDFFNGEWQSFLELMCVSEERSD